MLLQVKRALLWAVAEAASNKPANPGHGQRAILFEYLQMPPNRRKASSLVTKLLLLQAGLKGVERCGHLAKSATTMGAAGSAAAVGVCGCKGRRRDSRE